MYFSLYNKFIQPDFQPDTRAFLLYLSGSDNAFLWGFKSRYLSILSSYHSTKLRSLCSCVETVKSDSLVQGVTGSREGAAKVLMRGEQARITLAYSAFNVSVSHFEKKPSWWAMAQYIYCMFTENILAVPNMAQGHIILVHKKLGRGSAVKTMS